MCAQSVTISAALTRVDFEEGETIWTESSHKYRAEEVLAMAKRTGFRCEGQWIDASLAFEDPVFRSQPQTLPAGESLVWALAAETGRFKDRLRYPGEDDVYEEPKMKALGL